MSLNQTTSTDRKYTAFVIDKGCKPLPCVLCGCYPEEGDKALEINTGHPRLLCALCVATAMIGFEDLDRADAGYPAYIA